MQTRSLVNTYTVKLNEYYLAAVDQKITMKALF